MPNARSLAALLLCSAAGAPAQELVPVIARPVTLPRDTLDVTLHGTYTNWGGDTSGAPNALNGETLALGVDFGATDRLQLGVAAAFPINPGAAFGSVLANAVFALDNDKNAALRGDFGFENTGFNGDTTTSRGHAQRFFGGLGGRAVVPIGSTLAFVTGRTGAVQFGHFNNIGENGTGFYGGATALTDASSDFLVVSGGNNGLSTIVGINLPAGFLMQPDPHFAVTLQAGYSVAIFLPNGSGSAEALHFIPLGLEAVVTPVPRLDLAARFFLDGLLGGTATTGSLPGYFELRELMFWIRVHS